MLTRTIVKRTDARTTREFIPSATGPLAIVQRVLAAKNIKEARTGTIFAGYLKILPVFIFVLPGIVAMELVWLLEEDGELFARYRRR